MPLSFSSGWMMRHTLENPSTKIYDLIWPSLAALSASILIFWGLTKLALATLSRGFTQISTSNEDLIKIIDNVSVGIGVADAQGILRKINPAMLNMLACRAEELLGSMAESLFDLTDYKQLKPELERLGRDVSLQNFETRLLSREGIRLPILLSVSILTDKEGKLTGTIYAARDITELKRKDEQIRLKEAQLQQSEKLSLVGQLAAGIAHEINNPLGSILGFAQASILRLKEDDSLAAPLSGIEEEARRCKILVQDLLSFSRQESSQREDLDINQVIESVLSMISAQARLKSIEVKKELSLTEHLQADRNQIQQVIVNLCANALDALPRGGSLTVRTRLAFFEEQSQAVIEVQDNGPGIPKELQKRIFEPFFTTKIRGQGTGLGLALAQQIIRHHNGLISVSSEPGKTVFLVAIPLRNIRFA